MPQWTDKQLDCITSRNQTLLVSAAAGSGKTAVLIERIIQRITDEKNPISVDNLLVVTFTRAAASEMRDRLLKRISKMLQENPHDSWLQNQLILLPSAQITTVDSFCTELLRENASLVNLSPNYSVIDPQQASVMLDEAIDEIMEELYSDPNKELISLAESFIGEDYTDKKLKQAFVELYYFLSSCAFPSEWLQQQCNDLDESTPIEKTTWYSCFIRQVNAIISDCINLLNNAIQLCHEHPLTEKNYLPNIQGYLDRILLFQEKESSYSWDQLTEALSSVASAPRIGTIRGECEIKDCIQSLYNTVKDALKEYKNIQNYTSEILNQDRANSKPLVNIFSKVILFIDKRYKEKKQHIDSIDYSDMEQYALSLLVRRENGVSYPTEIAQSIANRYDEIYVDEYQDTNETQDEIYIAISKNETNLFFVGDVKQSIYSFRKARPDLFLKRRERYLSAAKNAAAQSIMLDSNFRSRKGIISISNFVFSQIMTKEACGIDYNSGEQLVYAAPYEEENSSYDPELLLVDIHDQKRTDASITAEATAMAKRIKELVGNLEINDKETGKRLATYQDICILLRTKSNTITEYMRVLKEEGIPVVCNQDSDFLHSVEVSFIMSLLRIIDNPLQDIPLLTIMLSPIGGFSIDDVAQIRIQAGIKKHLYSTMHRLKKQKTSLGEKIHSFIQLLEQYRLVASSLSANQMINRLYRELNILSLFAIQKRGAQRVANLHAFYNCSCLFEQDGFRGITPFIRYIQHISEHKNSYDIPTVQAESNAVQICTIHQSKGLEYPIVFLADLAHTFNFTDCNGDLLKNISSGIGLNYIESNNQIKHKTLMHKCIAKEIHKQNVEEEMRILYVAMTRAREKLIFVSSVQDAEKTIRKFSSPFAKITLPSTIIQNAKKPLDWILQTLLRHPSSVNLRQFFNSSLDCSTLPSDVKLTTSIIDAESLLREEKTEEEISLPPADKEKVKMLTERFAFEYPYQPLSKLSNKLTASQYNEETFISHNFVGVSRPAFLSKGLTAAEEGTAIHRFLQYSDWTKPGKNYDVEKEIHNLLDNKRLSKTHAEYLLQNTRGLRYFMESDLYSRIQKAERILREYPFAVNIPATVLLPKEKTEGITVPLEDIFVQGVIDCAFIENDHIILIDYKSNIVSEASDLIDIYKPQLKIYKMALELIFEKPVSEVHLFSLCLGESVCVPL